MDFAGVGSDNCHVVYIEELMGSMQTIIPSYRKVTSCKRPTTQNEKKNGKPKRSVHGVAPRAQASTEKQHTKKAFRAGEVEEYAEHE